MSRPPSQGAAIMESDVQYLTKIKHRNSLARNRSKAKREEVDKLLKKLIYLFSEDIWDYKDAVKNTKTKKSA